MPEQNKNKKNLAFKHTKGILEESLGYWLGLIFIVALMIWLLVTHSDQLSTVFGNAQSWKRMFYDSLAFLKQAFDPIQL